MPIAGHAPASAARTWIWRSAALLLGALFLASVARFYHPGLGFTALIGFPEGHEYEIPALRPLPHYSYPAGSGYDGQFYAQLAMTPLLRDPAIDRALDLPAYRARRILFSWTAYALGLGRPAWILEAFALQNVACWLILAWLLTRWIPPDSPRHFALWSASMFSHGLLWSVRFSLLDGPSLLLLALAVIAVERGRTWLAAGVLAAAGLARETNVLGGVLLLWPRGRRPWLRLAAAVIVALPLLVWQDYLWSIYRTTSLVGGSQISVPFSAYIQDLRTCIAGVRAQGWTSPAMQALLVWIALTVQMLYIVWIRDLRNPWWRLAAVFVVLMMIVDAVVWEGYPGAITRVVLPLTFGFNVLLARTGRGFWGWFVLGNLHLVAALHVLPIPGIPAPF